MRISQIVLAVFVLSSCTPQTMELQTARAAAKAFCSKYQFPADKLSELDGPPLGGPIRIKREEGLVTTYRWLGGGRGANIVQVEIDANGQITVYGGYNHKEFGPWTYTKEN